MAAKRLLALALAALLPAQGWAGGEVFASRQASRPAPAPVVFRPAALNLSAMPASVLAGLDAHVQKIRGMVLDRPQEIAGYLHIAAAAPGIEGASARLVLHALASPAETAAPDKLRRAANILHHQGFGAQLRALAERLAPPDPTELAALSEAAPAQAARVFDNAAPVQESPVDAAAEIEAPEARRTVADKLRDAGLSPDSARQEVPGRDIFVDPHSLRVAEFHPETGALLRTWVDENGYPLNPDLFSAARVRTGHGGHALIIQADARPDPVSDDGDVDAFFNDTIRGAPRLLFNRDTRRWAYETGKRLKPVLRVGGGPVAVSPSEIPPGAVRQKVDHRNLYPNDLHQYFVDPLTLRAFYLNKSRGEAWEWRDESGYPLNPDLYRDARVRVDGNGIRVSAARRAPQEEDDDDPDALMEAENRARTRATTRRHWDFFHLAERRYDIYEPAEEAEAPPAPRPAARARPAEPVEAQPPSEDMAAYYLNDRTLGLAAPEPIAAPPAAFATGTVAPELRPALNAARPRLMTPAAVDAALERTAARARREKRRAVAAAAAAIVAAPLLALLHPAALLAAPAALIPLIAVSARRAEKAKVLGKIARERSSEEFARLVKLHTISPDKAREDHELTEDAVLSYASGLALAAMFAIARLSIESSPHAQAILLLVNILFPLGLAVVWPLALIENVKRARSRGGADALDERVDWPEP